MPAEPLALSTRPPAEPSAETDYEAICAAVTATARGRWFLDEYARRNRNSDTAQVLAAIARMEAAVLGDRAEQAARAATQAVRIELLEMARTIAQTRAEVVESRPQASQELAAQGASASPAPDVAAAAERLRQIAWTMRACGVELPVSDQIGQIADAILSVDVRQNLGDQRAQRLTEALHYLEHRIDQMLDNHRAEAAEDAAAAPAAPLRSPRTNTHNRRSAAQRAAASDAAELPIGDDVVLTMAEDSPSAERPSTRAAAATLEASASATESVEPAPMAHGVEPASLAAVTTADVREMQVERDTPATEPPATATDAQGPAQPDQAPDDVDEPESTFVGLDLEPLVISPPATEAVDDLRRTAIDEPYDERTLVADATIDDFADEPYTDAGSDNVAGPAPIVAMPPAAAKADAIAMQVDQDFDDLTEIVPADGTTSAAALQESLAHGDHGQFDHALTEQDDDPADFLLEAPIDDVPPPAPPANMNAAHAMVSHALAAIEIELFSGTASPDARTDVSASSVDPATRAAQRAPTTSGPLAALMAMSDEERIALFS